LRWGFFLRCTANRQKRRPQKRGKIVAGNIDVKNSSAYEGSPVFLRRTIHATAVDKIAGDSGVSLRGFIVGLLAGLYCLALGGPGAAQDVANFKILRLEGNSVRWRLPENYRNLVVTYRMASAPAEFPAARNCRKMTSLADLLRTSEIPTAMVRGEIAAAFAMWEAAANINFREAAEGAPADILIGAQAEPEGWAFADVFYQTVSPEPIKPISLSLICLNPTKRWKVGFDGDLKTYDLRYTLAHEIGHAIGLDHPNSDGQIMGYRYEERFRSLQAGDVQGALLLYGKRLTASTPLTAQRQTDSFDQPTSGGARAFTPRSPDSR
jgi:hypothetical protein